MNLITATLLYKRANCLPKQFLGPPLNAVNTNGGISSHYFSHLYGLN